MASSIEPALMKKSRKTLSFIKEAMISTKARLTRVGECFTTGMLKTKTSMKNLTVQMRTWMNSTGSIFKRCSHGRPPSKQPPALILSVKSVKMSVRNSRAITGRKISTGRPQPSSQNTLSSRSAAICKFRAFLTPVSSQTSQELIKFILIEQKWSKNKTSNET
jgi:hypothetical protein